MPDFETASLVAEVAHRKTLPAWITDKLEQAERQDAIHEASFKRHFSGGDNESIFNGLEPVLGLGLLGVGPLRCN